MTSAFPDIRCFSFHGARAPIGPGPADCRGFTITLRNTILGRIPLDRSLARPRDLYMTTQKHSQETYNRAPAGIQTTIPASARPQAHALDGAAADI
jgi:hypothetical protein